MELFRYFTNACHPERNEVELKDLSGYTFLMRRRFFDCVAYGNSLRMTQRVGFLNPQWLGKLKFEYSLQPNSPLVRTHLTRGVIPYALWDYASL